MSVLVLTSSSLAGLELLEVPVADLHVAALLVHALCELLGGAGAVVAPLLGGRGLARGDGGVVLGRGLGGRGGAAAEHAANGVANG